MSFKESVIDSPPSPTAPAAQQQSLAQSQAQQERSDRAPGKSGKWKRRLLIFGSTLVVLIFAAWIFRAPLLSGMARAWQVGDVSLHQADAIVVLGGSIETRPFAAAELFHRKLSSTILVSQTESAPSTELGVTPAHHELNIAVMKKHDVPDDAVTLFGENVSSTWEEMKALQKWTQDTGSSSVIVITEIFPSRRLRWLFEKHCPDLEVQLHTVPQRRFDASNWWQDEQGLISFQNEVIKNLFYRVRY